MSKTKKTIQPTNPPIKERLKQFGFVAILIVITILALVSSVLAFYTIKYQNKIYPYTFIGDINFGNKTTEEATIFLQQKISANESIKVEVDNKPAGKIKPSEIDLTYDLNKTVPSLYQVGRSDKLIRDLIEIFRSMFRLKNSVSGVYALNNEKFADKLNKIAQANGTQAVDAKIILDEQGEVTTTPSKIGQGVALDLLTSTIKRNLSNFNYMARFANRTIEPKITETQTVQAIEVVKAFLGRTPINANAGETKLTIDREKVFSWIVYSLDDQIPPLVTASLDEEQIKIFITDFATNFDKEAQNATLQAKDGTVSVIKEHINGKKILVSEAVSAITTALNSPDTVPNSTVGLPVQVVEAAIRSNNIVELGIKEIIGKAETNFKGSPSNRVHNITTGANFLNGALVGPGEEFSTVKMLGKVDGSTGYLPELVIKENKTIPEFGGGLCQVSTTLFRSVLNAGLKVTERQNHSYRVSYYEPPVGLDATIYLPRPDFKFLNDTPGYILIQNKVEGTKIVFELYGTKDGRVSSTSEPIVTNLTDPPPPSYTDTDTLPKGEIKQIEKAHQGATAVVTYTVTRDGQEINKQVFRSKYKPWQARFLVGTKE